MVVKYVVIFQTEGLELESVLEDLRKYGDVTEVDNDELIADDGERKPITMIYVTSLFGDFIRLKLDYNCVAAEDCNYVLFPMASLDEKLKLEGLRVAGA